MIWKRLCTMSVLSGIAFISLSAAAMIVYPGGTPTDHAAAHYQFFHNPFSDLGRTHVFDGRSNLPSMMLFVSAMISGAAGLCGFFIAFAISARHCRKSRVLSLFAALFGITAAFCFIGVAATPWDLYMPLHIQFVFAAFRSLLLASTAALLAVLTDGKLSYRLLPPFVIFICLLIGYIALLSAGVSGHGAAAGAVMQAAGQKVIVYSAISMVTVQARQLQAVSER